MAAAVSIRIRRFWLALGWLWIALVLWLSLCPNPPQPLTFEFSDKLEHMLAYVVLMAWFAVVYRRQERKLAAVLLVGMGVLIEVLQGWSGYRYFEWADMAANTTGVLLGWWMMARTGDALLVRIGWE